jgi:trehalose/maltose hydrolase-like predicted phosphorylase
MSVSVAFAALAVQQYWRLTRDEQWLQKEGIHLAVGIATFWISHVEWNNATQVYNARLTLVVCVRLCTRTYASLMATQKYSINHVLGPDEYATGVNNTGINDNAYTNTIARISIEFAVEALQVRTNTPRIGSHSSRFRFNSEPCVCVCVSFAGTDPWPAGGPDVAQRVAQHLRSLQLHRQLPPRVRGLQVRPGRQAGAFLSPPHCPSSSRDTAADCWRHVRVCGQADTILMGYPALDQLSEQVRRNDLQYYEEVTDINGPAMSWGMFAIGWLEVGEYALAAKYFNQSYQYAFIHLHLHLRVATS